jgi:hypothetical protein
MESYPEQCAVPGGQSFTRQLSEAEQAQLNQTAVPAGWVEFTDHESGVSFYHPPEWTPKAEGSLVEESNPGKGITRAINVVGYESGDNQGIHINILPLGQEVQTIEFYLSDTLDETSDVSPIAIAGFNGVRYTWQSEVNEEALLYPDPHKALGFDTSKYRIWVVQGYNYGETDEKYAAEYESIVASFTVK